MNNKNTETTIEVVNVYPKKFEGEILLSDIEGTQQLFSYVKGVVHVGDEIVIKKDKHLVIEKIKAIVDYEQSDGSGVFEYVDYAGNGSVTIYVKDTGIKIPVFKEYQVRRNHLSSEEIEINEGPTKQKELDENSDTIACPTCGAPMKPNQYEGRYECPFCDNIIPFEDNENNLIRIEHMEYKTDNGFISIKHLNESKLDESLEWNVLDVKDKWFLIT